jgi:homospermidine synthase
VLAPCLARVRDIAQPYLGDIAGAHWDWTSLARHGGLFAEDVDSGRPRQVGTVRVA